MGLIGLFLVKTYSPTLRRDYNVRANVVANGRYLHRVYWVQHQILQELVCVASYKVYSTARRLCFTVVNWSVLYVPSSSRTNQPLFWRSSLMDLFTNKQWTHLHAFANMVQQVCQSLLGTVYAPYVHYICVWDRHHWRPSAMSAAALTHYAKIRGSIAHNHKHLRRNKGCKESRTEKQSLQQLRLQTLYSLGKNSSPTSRGGRLELSPSTKTFKTYL